ncbi:MAG: PEP-CTERM sorting domain-containing protein [Candidatus Acidiferrales bacterium]
MGQYGNHRDSELRSDFRRLNVILLFVATIIPVVLFIGGWRHVPQIDQRAASPVVDATAKAQDGGVNGIRLVNKEIPPSRIFPYSVIPGGAHSEAQLKNALRFDRVAAAHYAGFDVARTRVIRLSRAEKVYVSYRVGDRVYWTSKRLYVPAGETVLSDGEHEARTRCGNRLSETPQLPISAKEPSREVLNGPPIVMSTPTVTEALPAAALMQPKMDLPEVAGLDALDGRTFGPPPLIPIEGGLGVPPLSPSQNPPRTNPQPPVVPPSVPPPPITATPEPPSGLLFLLSAGLLGIFAVRRRLLS